VPVWKFTDMRRRRIYSITASVVVCSVSWRSLLLLCVCDWFAISAVQAVSVWLFTTAVLCTLAVHSVHSCLPCLALRSMFVAVALPRIMSLASEQLQPASVRRYRAGWPAVQPYVASVSVPLSVCLSLSLSLLLSAYC